MKTKEYKYKLNFYAHLNLNLNKFYLITGIAY